MEQAIEALRLNPELAVPRMNIWASTAYLLGVSVEDFLRNLDLYCPTHDDISDLI